MTIGAPQIILLFLYTLSLGISIARHGEPKNTKYNATTDLFGSALSLALLWWGGFFG